MAFEGLSDRLQGTMQKIRGKGKVTEADIKLMMREVRLALLEADVNFKVVKEFVKTVSDRALGSDVMKSLTPGQQVIKIVQEELTQLMGGENATIKMANKPPTVVMMVGLQGAGKTTTAGKLALLMRKQYNKKPLLVAADIYRPAAIDQLQTVGKQIDIPVYSEGDQVKPQQIVENAIAHAKEAHLDFVIIDTAGRLHVDEALMQELSDVKEITKPDEIMLVVDAMTGQDAVNVAESFDSQLEVSGVTLTKLDGDTRGGAALSIRSVTQKPIKFVGMSEKLDGLEAFHPERMASRILGMGDVLSLIEKAQTDVDEDKAKDLEKKMRTSSFTLEDFLEQLDQVKSLGPLDDIMKMIPGMNKMKGIENMNMDDKQIDHIKAIIQSMTPNERNKPETLNVSRKKRIAKGSGRSVQEINRLMKQFTDMKKMMKQFSGGGKGKKGKRKQMENMMNGMNLPF
ncbi:MAG: signal recognition particle protein [Staphylococcus equorum]|uniref:Signal recognition particle protein n=1 Tax=Staphylococcus equorum TaxID=246432 RepID=A0AAW7AG99_9STAP|nr:signal recognition particle protein [Staphylococcus equorum]MDG0821286.1 signal recognition particle protein [Staphylococcus equorum]MDG0837805.1 signal recognition particle protein [Staphylococcus equorum]MDK9865192.1 signal recognition particle protein [Staphylococcus equorum]MDK9870540.1 signal recognition particle protein [Staphylococcus equorum]MDK9875938.1 signal recognition particle protein [Staphylococcus equorum]